MSRRWAQPSVVLAVALGGLLSIASAASASSANLTTVSVASLAPATVSTGVAKVALLTYQITATAADTYDKVVVQYTGTSTADITNVYVYQESGAVPGTFSAASDTLRGSSNTQTGGAYTINPANFAVGAGATLQFYVVVDVSATATVGDVLDAKILADQITFTSGTWPPASEVTAGTWDPSGSTTIDLGTFTARADVGAVGLAGSSTHASGTYTVSGSGADIGAATDQFQFLYKNISGDGRITARVVTQGNTNALAKAGVVWRQSTANATRLAFLPITPANGTEFEWRSGTTGAASESGWSGSAIAAPYWVRLTRYGNSFTAESSPDGSTWTQVGSTQTVAMPAAALVGLGVTAHDNTVLGTATFDHVSVLLAPIAAADAYSLNEDGSLNVGAGSGVLANDSDPSGLSLSAVLISGTANGSLSLNANGSFSYSPNADFNGTDTFTYVARDSGMDSQTVTATITVTAVNDVPSFTKGADQSVNEDAGTQTVTGWATNLSKGPANEASQTLSFIVSNDTTALFATQPAVGATGTLTYKPAANAYGTATVSVQIHDNGGVTNGGVDTSAVQTFTITIAAVNDVPSFTKGANQTVLEDAGAQSVPWATNISPGPNEASQNVNFIVSNNNGALFSSPPAISPTGVLSYTSAPDANGAATVTVQIHDDGGTANGGVDTSAAQTFTITVTAVNDPPVISLPAGQSVMAGPHSLVLSGANGNKISISDVDIGAANIQVTLTVANGTVTLGQTTGLAFTLGDGNADAAMTFTGTLANANAALNGLVFTPAAVFAGAASIQVTANDLGSTGAGGAQITNATLVITVTNTAPVAGDDAYTMSRDNTLIVGAPGLLANDTDLEGQSLTVGAPSPVSGPSHGSLTLNADGSFSYTPTAGYSGTDSFTYTASDGLLPSASASVSITIRDFSLVPGSGWPVAFSASRYVEYAFPAYVPVGSVVTGATFHYAYRSLDSVGTTCVYLEVYAGGVLVASHGSAAVPLFCNATDQYDAEDVDLPEIDSATEANAVTVRVYVRNSSGAKTQTSLAELGVSSYLP